MRLSGTRPRVRDRGYATATRGSGSRVPLLLWQTWSTLPLAGRHKLRWGHGQSRGNGGRGCCRHPRRGLLAVGGFGLCGIPIVLIAALLEPGPRIWRRSRTTAAWTDGAWECCWTERIRRTISSYVGENKEFARQYLAGELEVELTPQGTLAERLRAGGAGIPAFYTAGRRRHAGRRRRPAVAVPPDGTVAIASPPKETARVRRPATYVLEHAISPTSHWCAPAQGDRHGNLVFHASAAQLQPAVRDGRPDHHRPGRAAGRAGRARPGRGPPARGLRAAGGRRPARRAEKRDREARPGCGRGRPDGADPRRAGGPGGPRAARRASMSTSASGCRP